jgi:hypothetical protein
MAPRLDDHSVIRRTAVFTRTGLIALSIATPAVLGAIALTVLGVSELLRQPPQQARTTDTSLADAIVDGDVERAFAFFHAGQDPNAPLCFVIRI